MGPGTVDSEAIVPSIPGPGEVDRTLASVGDVATVVLVEGASDRDAVQIVAARLGVDLAACRALVVSMGGVTNIGRFVAELGPTGRGLRLAGLCDERERVVVARALRRGGVDARADEEDLDRLGFFTCRADLEDELIRAAGVAGVETMLASSGELESFRRFQRQPAQREVPAVAQLHRFIGTRSTRKQRVARALAESVLPAELPVPLVHLVDHVAGEARGR